MKLTVKELRKLVREEYVKDVSGGSTSDVIHHKVEVIAYHGSNQHIRKFDISKTMDGTFWFSEDAEKILHGESGAAAIKWLIKVALTVDKIAGWEEYDKYYLEELERMGYNGIHLDDDWIVFDPSRIRIIDAKNITE